MPADWSSAQLGDVVELITGFPFASEHYTNDPLDPRLLRGDNIAQGVLRWDGAKRWSRLATADLEVYRLNEGDVVLAMDRPWIDAGLKYAAVRHSDLPALLVQRVARLRGSPTLDTRFLKYVIGSRQFTQYVLAVQTGTAVPHISGGQIKSFTFRLPPLDEQRAIAHILGTLDDKIELNGRMNNTLEAIARALFKSWFVDFDPVRAKAGGRDPGLPKPISDLFPGSFEDSEKETLPKGWQNQEIGTFLTLDKGLSYKGAFLADTGMPMVNLGCFLGKGKFSEKAIKHYTGEFRPQHVVDEGDLVIANTDITQKREVIGSPALVPPQKGGHKTIFTHHVFAARFLDGRQMWKLFTYFALLQETFRQRAAGFATGTTVLALPRDAVLNLPIIAPSLELVRVFDSVVEPLVTRIWRNAENSRLLSAIRDAMLPKLISGELRISAAERILGGLA